MILGKITGKVNTNKFQFLAGTPIKKFEFLQVMHKEYGFTLCQIIDIIKSNDNTTAECHVIGYNEEGEVKQIESPFEPGTEVLSASEDFIESVLDTKKSEGAYIGKLDRTDIKIKLDLNKILSKHISIIAKTGAGKSYCASVLIEEIMDKGIPLLIIDPHGEYSAMKEESTEDIEILKHFGIEKKGYIKNIAEYGDDAVNDNVVPLKINNRFKTHELLHILPSKLSGMQEGLIYSLIKDMQSVTIEDLIGSLYASDNNLKWNIISVLDYLNKLNIFSGSFTQYNDLIKSNRCAIINLKGIDPSVQEIIVFKLLSDLFENRKIGKIPPLFCVIEEAQNFVPERTYGEATSSKIIRTIASEGRKFGFGLCFVTQRPSRIEKNVLSQCGTQIVLKISNPIDLKAVSVSIEGFLEDLTEDVFNMPQGTAIISGFFDMPLMVKIRPKKSKHGGNTISLIKNEKDEEKKNVLQEVKEYSNKEILPLIIPNITKRDLEIINNKKYKTALVPCCIFLCERNGEEFRLLANLYSGRLITDIENRTETDIIDLNSFNSFELEILDSALILEKFSKETILSKVSLGVDKIQDILNKFYHDEILDINLGEYRITKKSRLISKTKDYSMNKPLIFEENEYELKLEKKFNEMVIKTKFERFLNILEITECFLVCYVESS